MRLTDKSQSQRSFTKDGYLVVPATISKLGVFDYYASELGIKDNAIKKVARTENSLFSDRTLQSFDGVPITIGHPKEGVSAENWKQLAVGSVRNVKRDNDTLIAEAWIYDQAAIKLIQEKGIEELSCGYDCDVVATTVNDADFEMSPMIGNHVAIVAKGRCGSTVKLADGEKTMSKTRKFIDAFLGAFGINLTDEQVKLLDEDDKDGSEEKEKSKPEPKAKSEEAKDEPNSDEDKEKEKMADAELQKKLDEANAQIKQLQDSQKASETRAKVLADAQLSFPNVKFTDSDTARQIQEKVLLDNKLATADELKTLSDEALVGMYQIAKKIQTANLGETVGKALMGDSKPTAVTAKFNQIYNS